MEDSEFFAEHGIGIGKTVLGWQIGRRLGAGSNGMVFFGSKNGQHAALKFERRRFEKDGKEVILPKRQLSLTAEMTILQVLAQKPNIPSLVDSGETEDFMFLAMKPLGPDVMTHLIGKGLFGKATSQFYLNMAIDTLRALEIIHKAGFIHGDVKPSNLCLGVDNESNSVFVIDYGASEQYAESKNNMLEWRPEQICGRFHGTYAFASIHVLAGYRPSPRDDLHALVYTIVAVATRLPFAQVEEPLDMLWEKRQMYPLSRLTEGNLPPSVSAFADVISTLKYGELPDYTALTNLLETAKTEAAPPQVSDIESEENVAPRSLGESTVEALKHEFGEPSAVASADVHHSSRAVSAKRRRTS